MTEPNWRETYQGGSPQAEQIEFARLADEIMKLQLVAMRKAKATATTRAFHAKPLLATRRATLRICDDISPDLCAGWVQRGRTYPTIVRFSNASPVPHSDAEKDVRGVALRVAVSEDEQHDLLMTNFPVSHARDARQFVAFAQATAGGPPRILLGIVPRTCCTASATGQPTSVALTVTAPFFP